MAREKTHRVGEQTSAVDSIAEADRLSDRLDTLYREAKGAAHAVDLYHRASITLRLSQRAEGESVATIRGNDDGLAVRTRSKDGRIGFAACSGLTPENLRWALDACRESPSRLDAPSARWTGRGDLADQEASPELPTRDDLTAWVRDARPARGPCPAELWVEVATTIETWVSEKLRASRTRTRAWALLRMPEGGHGLRPAVIAARRWSELPTTGWSDILDDRYSVGPAEATPPDRPVPVIFSPETSAILVRALVETLHVGDPEQDLVVGPAWSVNDDPADPGALSGGTFDDVGFRTHRKRLADGKKAVGWIAGTGHHRRPSYRDFPTPRPSHLVVTAKRGAPPPSAVLVSGLALHVLARDRWALEIDGATMDDSRPGARLRPSFIVVSPKELVRRCISAVGPPRLSHLGVHTPALVFDGLSVEG